MPGPSHKKSVEWLSELFDTTYCTECRVPISACIHKPENKGYCIPDVVGIFNGRIAFGEVTCRSAEGPCEYKVIDTTTGRILDQGRTPY